MRRQALLLAPISLAVLAGACGGDAGRPRPTPPTGGVDEAPQVLGLQIPDQFTDEDMALIQDDARPVSSPPQRDHSYAPAERRGGRLVRSGLGDPKSFNVIVASETSSTDLLRPLVFRPLLEWNNVTQEIEPGFAHTWGVDETGLAWSFQLREGLVFSDGSSLDSRSVERFFRVIYTEDLANSSVDMFNIDGEHFTVETPDPLTVVIRTPSMYSAMPFQASQNLLPLPEAGWEDALTSESPADVLAAMFQLDADLTEIVGSGPFLFESFEDGVQTVMRRNPNYQVWDAAGQRLPHLDELITLSVPDLNARRLRFEAGETDYHGILPQNFAPFRDGAGQGDYQVWDLGAALGSSFFWFNLRPGANEETGEPFVDPVKLAWFSQRDFRIACSHAVNRQSIINNLYRGRASEQRSKESESNQFWHNPNATHHGYDLARANELLDGLDFIDHDGDGIREHPEGAPIRFTMITNVENELRVEAIAMIQQDLREVGIDVVPSNVEFNALITRINDTYHYEAALLGLTGSIDPTDGLNVFRSGGEMHLWNPLQESPATEAEARIDDLCNLMLGTLDREEQRAHYFEIQDILGQENFTIYTVTPNIYLATRNNFHNWSPGAMRPRVLWNLGSIWRADVE